MDDLKAQIKFFSSQAANYAREAKIATQAREWGRSMALMKEAVAASKNCQRLIKELETEANQSEKA